MYIHSIFCNYFLLFVSHEYFRSICVNEISMKPFLISSYFSPFYLTSSIFTWSRIFVQHSLFFSPNIKPFYSLRCFFVTLTTSFAYLPFFAISLFRIHIYPLLLFFHLFSYSPLSKTQLPLSSTISSFPFLVHHSSFCFLLHLCCLLSLFPPFLSIPFFSFLSPPPCGGGVCQLQRLFEVSYSKLLFCVDCFLSNTHETWCCVNSSCFLV